ncbi:uncharacterized protein V1516DRAFT_665099 [Lipomyces oligophaga]|uniref:uncharacterized protein n=1 Tax=Lipomyces oligophaga TaxID=45792 RepID=UPI0034CDDC66
MDDTPSSSHNDGAQEGVNAATASTPIHDEFPGHVPAESTELNADQAPDNLDDASGQELEPAENQDVDHNDLGQIILQISEAAGVSLQDLSDLDTLIQTIAQTHPELLDEVNRLVTQQAGIEENNVQQDEEQDIGDSVPEYGLPDKQVSDPPFSDEPSVLQVPEATESLGPNPDGASHSRINDLTEESSGNQEGQAATDVAVLQDAEPEVTSYTERAQDVPIQQTEQEQQKLTEPMNAADSEEPTSLEEHRSVEDALALASSNPDTLKNLQHQVEILAAQLQQEGGLEELSSEELQEQVMQKILSGDFLLGDLKLLSEEGQDTTEVEPAAAIPEQVEAQADSIDQNAVMEGNELREIAQSFESLVDTQAESQKESMSDNEIQIDPTLAMISQPTETAVEPLSEATSNESMAVLSSAEQGETAIDFDNLNSLILGMDLSDPASAIAQLQAATNIDTATLLQAVTQVLSSVLEGEAEESEQVEPGQPRRKILRKQAAPITPAQKQKLTLLNRLRKQRWREVNYERNKDNDLRQRVHRRANAIFGKEVSDAKSKWIEEEYRVRRERRLSMAKNGRDRSRTADGILASLFGQAGLGEEVQGMLSDIMGREADIERFNSMLLQIARDPNLITNLTSLMDRMKDSGELELANDDPSLAQLLPSIAEATSEASESRKRTFDAMESGAGVFRSRPAYLAPKLPPAGPRPEYAPPPPPPYISRAKNESLSKAASPVPETPQEQMSSSNSDSSGQSGLAQKDSTSVGDVEKSDQSGPSAGVSKPSRPLYSVARPSFAPVRRPAFAPARPQFNIPRPPFLPKQISSSASSVEATSPSPVVSTAPPTPAAS